MASTRAFRSFSPVSVCILACAGWMQGAGLARAADQTNDLDTLAYGAFNSAKPARGGSKASAVRPADPVRAIETAPNDPSSAAIEENSPGLLAVLGLDSRSFGAAPRQSEPSFNVPSNPRVLAPVPAPSAPIIVEDNSPGLLAAIGLDRRMISGPPPHSAPVPLEAHARIVAPIAAPVRAEVLEENSPGFLAAIGLDRRVVPAFGPPVEVVAAVAPQPILIAARSTEYRLGPGDRLRVVVFGQEGLTNSYAIDASGAITLPLIGRVSARGHTPGALAADITARLRKGFIREPSVAVEIESYRPFFILGEVAAPGQYPYVPNMSVEAAIAIAGGFSPRARRDSVTVTHPAEGGLLRAIVPLGTPLSPGDTIMVSERWF